MRKKLGNSRHVDHSGWFRRLGNWLSGSGAAGGTGSVRIAEGSITIPKSRKKDTLLEI